jgi:hypothetical protein
MTAAVDLDALLNTYASFLAEGGKDLLTYPFYFRHSGVTDAPLPACTPCPIGWEVCRYLLGGIIPMSMPKFSQENFGMVYESGYIQAPAACP